MRLRKNFLIGVGASLVAMALIGALVLWRLGLFNQNFRALTDKDVAEALAKMHGPAPVIQTAPERIESGRRVRLAIGSIGLPIEQSQNVSDLTLAQLNDAKGLEMIERQALDKVLAELQLSAAGLVRANDAVRAGKLLRADWFLLGTPAIVNATNVAVVRIVDARTGVMRDAAMIPNRANAQALASQLAAFVRQSRQDAGNPRPKTYLAIGGFEDVSLNNRRAELPGELRSYLTAAYQGSSGVTVLEREFVNTLLQEMYLDLAGLTDESATNAPRPIQAAYWMADGFYQSYETTNLQVELVLNVRRMFGRNHKTELRDKPGEPLFRRVKETIDGTITPDKTMVVTRLTELQSQLSTGSELLNSVHEAMNANAFSDWLDYTGQMSSSEAARHRRNLEEAMRAFQTALLLEPTNRKARAELASCLSSPFIGKFDDARELYREVIDAPIDDRWTAMSKDAVNWSFERFVSPVEKQRWFESAASRAVNKPALEYFQSQLKEATEAITLRKVGTPEAEKVAEERLFRDIRAWDSEVKDHMFTIDFDNTGLGKFTKAFGTNHALAARKMVALLPRLQSLSTNLAPHIFAGVVTFQVETNAPIIAEFERSLDSFAEKGGPVPQPQYYIQLLASPVYRWAEEHRLYRLAAKLKEIKVLAAAKTNNLSAGDEDRIGLAFNYVRAEQWQKALQVFQSYSNRPVHMGNSGLWGPAFTVVLTSKQANLCREKLGLPKAVDPREFELAEPCLHFHDPKRYSPWGVNPVIAAATDRLWIGMNEELMCLDFDLQTNFVVQLPSEITSPISAIHLESSKVWLGTVGSGLIEIDKATKNTTHLTEKDGLLMNYVSALRVIGDTLWIGYGNESAGGLGKLDLKTRHCTSFTASLSTESLATKPPRNRVTQIRPDRDGNIWFMVQSSTMRFRVAENVWEAFPNQNGVWVACYEMYREQLIKALRLAQEELTIETKPKPGTTNSAQKTTRLVSFEESAQLGASLRTNGSQYVIGSKVGGIPDKGILAVRSLRNGSERRLLETEPFPSFPTTVTLVGHDLWVGGQGFVALVDLDANKIKKLAYVPAATVDEIQLGGGDLWVQCDKHIYRTRL